MTLKAKLISLVAMICLVAGIMLVGIFAAETQQIKLNGQVNFEIADKSLYVKDVRMQENMDTSTIYSLQDSGRFMPGYVNGEFNMNLGFITLTLCPCFSHSWTKSKSVLGVVFSFSLTGYKSVIKRIFIQIIIS